MEKFKDTCPKCGSHLILRDGQFGEFLACPRFPDCRYTRSLLDREDIYNAPPLYCKKCNHTGLLPFINKSGKKIANAFTDCECKTDLPEYAHDVRLRPEDYDFALSDTFRGFTFEYCGEIDPQRLLTPRYVEVETKIPAPPQQGNLQPIRAELNYLQNKINAHIDASKKKQEGYY